MKIVKIGRKNQVTIPSEIVRELELRAGEYLLANSRNGEIILAPAEINPAVTSSHEGEDRTQGFLNTKPKEE